MAFIYNKLIAKFEENSIEYRLDEPMREHTTFRIGGNADVYVLPSTIEELIEVIKAVKKENFRFFVMGRGSNVIFADKGYDGVIVTTEKLKAISVEGNKIYCEAGVQLNVLSVAARDNNLAGLAFAYGIPGYVGGAVFMNAGAYGGEIADVLVKTTYYDTEKDVVAVCEGAEHKFGYRESVYREHPERIILSAEFELKNGNSAEIKAEMDDYMERRRSKQPLEYPSAGSVFKRCPNHFTGKLIEDSGLKGKTIGGAQVSEKHAGFIINIGGATADNVLELIEFIKCVIRTNYDLELVCEMIYID